MYPRLFELPWSLPSYGPITVYTYGVLLAAAYLLGLKLAMVRAKQRGLDANRVLDLGIYIISALIGAKLLLLVTDFRTFTANPRELLTLARSGGVFYGGLILAVSGRAGVHPPHRAAALDDVRRVCAGHRLGTSSAGSGACSPVAATASRRRCHGASRSHDPFAATNVGTPLGVPLHPTQLYERGRNS